MGTTRKLHLNFKSILNWIFTTDFFSFTYKYIFKKVNRSVKLKSHHKHLISHKESIAQWHQASGYMPASLNLNLFQQNPFHIICFLNEQIKFNLTASKVIHKSFYDFHFFFYRIQMSNMFIFNLDEKKFGHWSFDFLEFARFF